VEAGRDGRDREGDERAKTDRHVKRTQRDGHGDVDVRGAGRSGERARWTGRDARAEESHGRRPAWGGTVLDRWRTARGHSSSMGPARDTCAELRQRRGKTGQAWWRRRRRGHRAGDADTVVREGAV
jgi:hypothetical protein